jgi:hypothetical protein
MGVTVTVPADTKTPGTAAHTSDHNLIVDAITALSTGVADTISEFGAGVLLDTATPSTPASGKSVLYSSSNGQPQAKSDTGMSGSLPYTASDGQVFTVTTAAAGGAQASHGWVVPGNDAAVGTIYKIKAWGGGVQGSTAQNLTFSVNGLTTANRASSLLVATVITLSLTFDWMLEIIVQVVTTGAGGTANVNLAGSIQAHGGTQQQALAGNNGGTGYNTTASATLQLMLQWASTTGAPTAHCDGSYFERIGP